MDTILGMKAQAKPYARFGLHNLRLNFRVWRRSRPFWAGLIALVGGLPMWYFPMKAVQFLFVSKTPIWQGILVGVLVETFALLLWIQPAHRTMYGVFIVLLSLVSFITSDFGGLFIGMLLGILGGSLALAWTPVMGKTKHQQKWLAKSGVVVPAADTIVLDEPLPVLALEPEPVEQPDTIELEPVALTEAEAAVVPADTMVFEQPPAIIDITEAEAEPGSDIDITGWELPPDQPLDLPSEAIDLTEDAEAPPQIDLREEKATTAPPPSDVDRPGAETPGG
ncbi:MAG TPA: DUF6114 domain-containing protein [Actinomycetota bacterium]|nr:DUF6114 domain-containing protein [Actinomycetota bacterium]